MQIKSLLLLEHNVSGIMVPVLAGKVVRFEGHHARDCYTALPLSMRSSLAKAGTDAPSLPETSARFNTTADQE